METPKRPAALPDDRPVGPRCANPVHNGFVARRAGGSSVQGSKSQAPIPDPWTGVVETEVWQSPSGATASMVVSFDELPRPSLWNENDENRHPRETQPAASTTPQPEAAIAWEPYVRDWTASLRGRRRSEGTVRAYERCARRALNRIGKSDLRDMRFEDVERCLASLETESGGWQPNTRNVYIASLRSFWRYAVVMRDLGELGVRDIGAKLEPLTSDVVDREKVQHPVLTRDEFLAVLRQAEADWDRDWSLAARYLWTTISRVSDAASLTWGQLDLGASPKAFYAKPSKRGSNLTKLLDAGLARRLKALQRLRAPTPSDRVFAKPGEGAKGFANRFNRCLRRYAADAGLAKYVHAHLIRASAATHATVAGCPELFMMRQGGWKARTALDAYRREDPETWRKWVVALALD